MRNYFIVLLLLLSLILYGQDTIRVRHTAYTTLFDRSKNYPKVVQWTLTRDHLNCAFPLKRGNNFEADPLVMLTNFDDSYKDSGLDRGHLSPAADNQCLGVIAEQECFYYTNMMPQYHDLNGGDWKDLETYSRELALAKDSLIIWAGGIGEAKKIGCVSVPTHCWKVIYIVKDRVFKAYLFGNSKGIQIGFEPHITTLAKIEELTGLTFAAQAAQGVNNESLSDRAVSAYFQLRALDCNGIKSIAKQSVFEAIQKAKSMNSSSVKASLLETCEKGKEAEGARQMAEEVKTSISNAAHTAKEKLSEIDVEKLKKELKDASENVKLLFK